MQLNQLSKKVAVAESCTGGAIANAITDVAGASNYFLCGVVAYSNRSKKDFLGVKEATLKKFGAVSEQVAAEMAKGIRKKSGATYGISVTGIAGPTGGTKAKPVGTVYIALAGPKKTEARHFCFQCDRLEFKRMVVKTALDWLRRVLLKVY